MIDFEKYKKVVRDQFTSKKIVNELGKRFEWEEGINSEVKSFYFDKKRIGLLFLRVDNRIFVTKFTKAKIKPDKNGRVRPITCDLCYTLLPGSKISHLICERDEHHIFSWLACSALNCSMNVRELTEESLESKKLMGENASVNQKIKRLEMHIKVIVETLNLKPLRDK